MGLLTLRTIPYVDALDFPSEVEEYFMEHGLSVHSQNDIVSVDDDGNVFAKWLKGRGYEFPEEGWGYVAVFAD